MAKGKPAKERRRHSRTEAPQIIVAIDDQHLGAVNLSVGGALVEDYDGSLAAGAELMVTGIGPSEHTMAPVTIPAWVNRADPKAGHLALTFHDLDARTYEVLQIAMANKAKRG